MADENGAYLRRRSEQHERQAAQAAAPAAVIHARFARLYLARALETERAGRPAGADRDPALPARSPRPASPPHPREPRRRRPN